MINITTDNAKYLVDTKNSYIWNQKKNDYWNDNWIYVDSEFADVDEADERW